MKEVSKLLFTTVFLFAFANIFAQAGSQDSAYISSDPYSLKYRILALQDANSDKINTTFNGLNGFQYQSIICRKENEVEEKTHLPLRLRLGSLKYTDQMEGKYEDYTIDN